MVLLVLNKPAGIVCTAEKREKNNVIDFMKYPKRIYYSAPTVILHVSIVLLTITQRIPTRMQ